MKIKRKRKKMKKTYVEVKVRLTIRANDGQDINEVLEDMDYNFVATNGVDADIEDMEIKEWRIEDSK